MVTISKIDPVDFLISHRFGVFRRERVNALLGDPPETPEAQAYRQELVLLPPEELQQRFESAKAEQRDRAQKQAEREEAGRFFNLPSATSDVEHWSRMAQWSADEACALSFGKAPEVVTLKKLSILPYTSAFVTEYLKRSELIRRAILTGQLSQNNLPGFFIAWLNRMDIPVDQRIVDALERRGVQIADWKGVYDRYKASTDELIRSQVVLIGTLKDEVVALEQQIASASKSPNPTLTTRERDSLLKLVIGTAMGGYGYVPGQRSEIPRQIASDLASRGMSLDEDTVRKWLKEATALLPPEPA